MAFTLPNWLTDPQFLGLVVSGTLAILLTFFIDWVQNSRRKTDATRHLATMLGYEIASIKEMVATLLDYNQKQLAQLEKDILSKNYRVLILADADLPRAVYDNSIANLEMLPPRIAADISELYRGVELCTHAKNTANDFANEAKEQLEIWNSTHSGANEAQFKLQSESFILTARVYFGNLEGVVSNSIAILKKLVDIAKIPDPTIRYASLAQYTETQPDNAAART